MENQFSLLKQIQHKPLQLLVHRDFPEKQKTQKKHKLKFFESKINKHPTKVQSLVTNHRWFFEALLPLSFAQIPFPTKLSLSRQWIRCVRSKKKEYQKLCKFKMVAKDTQTE